MLIPSLWLVIAFATLLSDIGAATHVGSIDCSGTIPIDSQFMFNPIWSLSPFKRSIAKASGGSWQLTRTSLSSPLRQIVQAESGMNADSVVLFRFLPTGDATDASCVFYLDPLKAGMDGNLVRGARLVVLDAGNSATNVCEYPLEISVKSHGDSSDSKVFVTSSSTSQPFTPSISFSGASVRWPLEVRFSVKCQVSVLLLVDRVGGIDHWYVWIPTTVYTAVVTAMVLPVLLVRTPPLVLTGILVVLIFFGFLGSCIGLLVELINWQSALGRMFPFPSSVTLYCCLTVLYALFLIPVVYRKNQQGVMLSAVLRLLLYAANVALCVGYWVSGYVLLGSLALGQYIITNAIFTFYFAYISVRLKHAMQPELDWRFSDAFIYLWCIPVTPFAPCILLYFDLYIVSNKGLKASAEVRLRDVVYVYNTQMSIPLLFFQGVYGIALLCAATAYHMPFAVVLFVMLFFTGLHTVYTLEQYGWEWRRWRRRGQLNAATWWGWISLGPVMDYLLDGENTDGRYYSTGSHSGGGSAYAGSDERAGTGSHLNESAIHGMAGPLGSMSMLTYTPTTGRNSALGNVAPANTAEDVIAFPQFPNHGERQPVVPLFDATTAENAPSPYAFSRRSGAGSEAEYWPDTVER